MTRPLMQRHGTAGAGPGTVAPQSLPRSSSWVKQATVLSTLGGLPTDRAWLEAHHIGMSLSAMDKIAADCRGGVSARQVYQFNVPVGHQGALRDRQLKLVLPIFLATLYSGYSVLVHCMAGVHRAPVLAGLLLAWIRRCSFEEAYSRLEGLRAIDQAGVLSRRGGSDIFKWARSQVNITSPSLPRYPISFSLPLQKQDRTGMWSVTTRPGADGANAMPLTEAKSTELAAFMRPWPMGEISVSHVKQCSLAMPRSTCTNNCSPSETARLPGRPRGVSCAMQVFCLIGTRRPARGVGPYSELRSSFIVSFLACLLQLLVSQ